MSWQKASYTVEAGILIPLFLGIILFAMKIGISFYKECTQTQQYDRLQIDIMETFYAYDKWNIE